MSRTRSFGSQVVRPYTKKVDEREQLWKSGSVYLGCNPSKGLLNDIAENLGLDAVEVYQGILSDCYSSTYSQAAVGGGTRELAVRYFGTGGVDLKFCSIHETQDLSHLRLFTGCMFVVYQWHPTHGLQRVFDNRVLLNISQGCHFSDSECKVYVLEALEGQLACFGLHKVGSESSIFAPGQMKELDSHFSVKTEPVGPCLLSSLANLLGKSLPRKLLQRSFDNPWTLERLCEERGSVRKYLGSSFLLGTHVGYKPWKKKQHRVLDANRLRFKVFATFARDDFPIPWTTLKVVALSNQGVLALLSKEAAEVVITARRPSTSVDPGRSNQAFPHGRLTQELLDERYFLSQGYFGSEEALDGGAQGQAENSPEETPRLARMSPCHCEMCDDCEKYRDNLDERGSQKLYQVDWSLHFFLKAFNLDTKDNLERVKLCQRLTVAAMDLETSTVSLDKSQESPNQGFLAPHEKLTPVPRQASGYECLQRILLIGHADDLWEDLRSAPCKLKIFETPRAVSGVRDSVHNYVSYILRRQRKMSLRKRVLLAPLLQFIRDHKKVFFKYFADMEVDPSFTGGSWKNSILGRFERRVESLCKKYYIYAFNGAGFDFPLLCGHVATSPNSGGRWKIQRNGSSVTMLSLPGRGVYFRDLKKMLVPGFSLSSLASTVGLKDSKMKFPYGILRGYGEALDLERLPRHGEDWFDTLTQRIPDETYVGEALEDFEKLQCRSVRDYLVKYLEMDLLLLLRSSHLLLEKFEALTGVAPVECDKSTLSSYSMYCSQMFLVINKRPGAFCNNNPAIYNVIKNSLRGGLTLVTRSSVNAGEKEALNEPHLRPGDCGLEPKTIHYLDVSGLYSAAGE